MKPAAAWKRKDFFDDIASGICDFLLCSEKIGCVNYEQQTSYGRSSFLREAASEAPIEEARVVRSVILEFPPEYGSVKLFRNADVLDGHLDVIDLVLMFFLAHETDCMDPDLVRIVNIGQVCG
jgi:hypothetical protein